MKYVLKPSLEHMTNIKIVAALFNQDDVKDLLEKIGFLPHCQDFKSKWLKIEGVVVEKVENLPLPEQVKRKLLCFIRPVGFQIAKWSQFINRFCNLKVNLPNEFYWMPQGTINEKKTAEEMLKNENVDNFTHYKLACIFCLEDEIKKLWGKIPEGCRNIFYSQENPMYVKQNELVVFWTHHIKGEMVKMESRIEKSMGRRCSPYQYAFNLAAWRGNRVATEYFLHKLTSTEREESLVKTAMTAPFKINDCFYDSSGFLKEMCSDILYFLLSELNEEQQIEACKTNPHLVLMCFLDWPLQIFFLKTANRLWNFLGYYNYGKLLIHIIDKIKHGYKDFDYQKLFREFWKQSPNGYKKHFFNVCCDRHILTDLFKLRDENNIKLVFHDAIPKDKKYLFYNNNARFICSELIYGNQLSLLKYFIKECLPSKDEVIEFKKDLENGVLWTWPAAAYLMSNWERKFVCMLDDIICEFKKCEGEDRSIAKGVCSAEFSDVAHSPEK